MPLLETKGAASAQGFGGAGAGASGLVTYIEDVFSTYLYTGNGSTQTITNGIDLSGKGGLVWIKGRTNTFNHFLRSDGIGDNYLSSNTTASATNASSFSYVNSTTGFSITTSQNILNGTGNTYASWTFRKQPKFFDVVTYTGNGSNRTISHNLGSVPGCIIVKRTDAAADWQVYHRSLANTQYLVLNDTAAAATGTTRWNSTTPTSTVFSLGTDTTVNANGGTYVAYLFAHNAGGFGLSGTDNVISCGSFTTNGSGVATVNLGYEPQWVLFKFNSSDSWRLFDNMRGMSQTNWNELNPNTDATEIARINQSDLNIRPSATGFTITWSPQASKDCIYIAIRRGPMKVPTSGTSVFTPVTYTGDNTSTKQLTSGFPIDLIIGGDRSSPPSNVFDRLRGVSSASPASYTASTADEQSSVYGILGMTYLQTGDGTVRYQNSTGVNYVDYFFRRAPSFFDEVCFTATGSNFSVTHNLGTAPELVITKERNGSRSWFTYAAGAGNTKYLVLDGTAAASTGNAWQNTTPTSTTLYLTGGSSFFSMSQTYVAYLFATCPGVSKVGSYIGTGTTKQIDCGFTGGARFVMIKRTDSTGDWFCWDSARGIVAGNDPYLLLNSTAAEVTNTDYVDTYSAGFEISSTAPAAINANGGTFIFLAIA